MQAVPFPVFVPGSPALADADPARGANSRPAARTRPPMDPITLFRIALLPGWICTNSEHLTQRGRQERAGECPRGRKVLPLRDRHLSRPPEFLSSIPRCPVTAACGFAATERDFSLPDGPLRQPFG